MPTGHIAVATSIIHHPIETVWKALLDPATIAKYMMGAQVVTDWKEGSPILWKGEWQGKPFVDHGTVLVVREPDMLKYIHISGTNGNPEQEHTITIELKDVAGVTHVRLGQDNNATEAARDKSSKKWSAMLDALKVAMGEAPVPQTGEMRV